jgi:hypothetical protein
MHILLDEVRAIKRDIQKIDVGKETRKWLTEVIHNGRNLIHVQATQMNKYVCALMKIMYTEEERSNGVVGAHSAMY